MTYIWFFFLPYTCINSKRQKNSYYYYFLNDSKSYYMWKWLEVSIRSICPTDYCIGQYLSKPSHRSIRKIPNQKAHGILFDCESECLSHHASTFHSKHIMIIWQWNPMCMNLKLFTFATINLGLYINLLLLKVWHHTLILNPLGVPFFMIYIILPTYVLHHLDLVTINVLPTFHTFKTWGKKVEIVTKSLKIYYN
jgi:hypothetical protein